MIKEGGFEKLNEILENYFYIPVTELPNYQQIKELFLVTNVLKHGDGDSFRKLSRSGSKRFAGNPKQFEPEDCVRLSRKSLKLDISRTNAYLYALMEYSRIQNHRLEDFMVEHFNPLCKSGRNKEAWALLTKRWPAPSSSTDDKKEGQ